MVRHYYDIIITLNYNLIIFLADEDNVEHHSCGALSCILGTLCFGVGLCSCFTVSPKEEVVLLDFGKYNGTVKDPGMLFVHLFTISSSFSFDHLHPSSSFDISTIMLLTMTIN